MRLFFSHLESYTRPREIWEGYKSKTSRVHNTVTDMERRTAKNATKVHLRSSLSQAEELGALFAGRGSAKILVEFTEPETSPV